MTDYPLSLAGSHGRIAAYRAALEVTAAALAETVPYVRNVAGDPDNSPWRRETAEGVLIRIHAARVRAAAELAVTS